MQKRIFFVLMIAGFIKTGNIIAQENFLSSSEYSFFENQKPVSLKKAESSVVDVAIFLFPLNPILLVENKKFYAGITKEFSIGQYPYGRIACEYSLIFRETHLNQLRFSYNYDFVLETGDFAAFMLTTGAGYFTDFNKEGYFPQASFNVLVAVHDNIGIDPYLKFRYTIMTDSNESNIFDMSFGLASVVYF